MGYSVSKAPTDAETVMAAVCAAFTEQGEEARARPPHPPRLPGRCKGAVPGNSAFGGTGLIPPTSAPKLPALPRLLRDSDSPHPCNIGAEARLSRTRCWRQGWRRSSTVHT